VEEIVRAEGVRHVYPDGTAVCFGGQPLVVHRRERVAVLGPNGSGKTTLLFHLLGLLKPAAGTVRVFGVDPGKKLDQIRRRVGVLLQNPAEQIIAPTVRDDVAFSPRNAGMPRAEVMRRVEAVARELEIAQILDRVPQYLSGGEQRKVALAGALVSQPELLVLDEPFEGLDALAKTELKNLLANLHARAGLAIIITTHEINLIPELVDTVYLLARGGEIVFKGTPRELFGRPDLLEQHHLEPPVLVSLFQTLRQRGIAVSLPTTVAEAADELERLLAQQVAF